MTRQRLVYKRPRQFNAIVTISIATPSDATFYPIRVLSLQVEIGRDIAADAPLALLESAAGKQILVRTPQAGRVVATALAPGDVIWARAVLVRIDPEPAAARERAPAPNSQPPPRAQPLGPALLRQHARRSTALGFGPIAEAIRAALRADGVTAEVIAASEDRIAEAAAEQAGRARAEAKAAAAPAHPAAPKPQSSVAKTHPATLQPDRTAAKTTTPPKPKTFARPPAPKRSINVDAWSLPAAIVTGLGVAWGMGLLPDDPGRVMDGLRASLADRLGWSHAPTILTDAALEIPDVVALDEAPQPAFDADRQAAFERFLAGSP